MFRTFPTFDAVLLSASITANSTVEIGRLATLHAQHIFDLDKFKASQYLTASPPFPLFGPKFLFQRTTIFPNTSLDVPNTSFAPFLNAVTQQGFSVSPSINISNANDLVSIKTDTVSQFNFVFGSRLLSPDVYRDNASAVGALYSTMLDAGMPVSEGPLAGGQVSKNANINSAVHPKWRTAKSHMLITAGWDDAASPSEVEDVREDLTKNKVPILQALQTTFFGDYTRSSAIKETYDPRALFIVVAGVGSEKWDADGLCRVA